MKIVIAFDSFKGSATSGELAQAAAEGVASALHGCCVETVSIADGGEGTTEAVAAGLGASRVVCRAVGPLGEEIEAEYAVASSTAIIELAAASGLSLVPEGQRNPLVTSTFGTGMMIADAMRRRCRNIVLGLGGSATNDAATGILSALGARFCGCGDMPLTPCGENLGKIKTVDNSSLMPELKETRFTLACDVRNPFCGPDGAAFVFAPQKGADSDVVRRLDEGMRSYAAILLRTTGTDITAVAGAGAAGGVAGGLLPFTDSTIRSGIDTVLDIVRFDDILDGADLVLTGEGRLDSQSAMGKAVGGIVRRASARNIPIVALAGSVADCRSLLDSGLTAAFSIQRGPVSLAAAMDTGHTLACVRVTAAMVARMFSAFRIKDKH